MLYEAVDRYTQMCPQCRNKVSYAPGTPITRCHRCRVRMITMEYTRKNPFVKLARTGIMARSVEV